MIEYTKDNKSIFLKVDNQEGTFVFKDKEDRLIAEVMIQFIRSNTRTQGSPPK